MNSKKKKTILAVVSLTLVITLTILTTWVLNLNETVKKRLEGRRFSPPIEFYSAPTKYFRGQTLTSRELETNFSRIGLKKRPTRSNLQPASGSYSLLTQTECDTLIPPEFAALSEKCYIFRFKKTSAEDQGPSLIALGTDNLIIEVFQGSPMEAKTVLELKPELFAQFYGAEPILRDVLELGEVPPACLNAVLAIEDPDFLEHKGISVSGLTRAIIKNILSGRYAQGGSTITQQLVKNYFLSPEKTLKRKATEIAMSILVENHASKDEILETYVNEIYMGQMGSFQIRGLGAASDHYFNKAMEELNLEECALIAAIINNPGRFDPFNHPEESKKRRDRVLDKMVELKVISAQEANLKKAAALPKRPVRALSEPAPFFVEAVRRQIDEMSIDRENGLKVFTTLNLKAQEAAQLAIARGVEALEKNNKVIQKNKEAGQRLEASLIAADPLTGFITSVVGGRKFKESQFNRAISSKRQVGSIMKPLVYLTALLNTGKNGEPYTPLSILKDDSFTVKYEGQKWSPKNYDKKFYGDVPMYFALKNSLNAATASLALEVGLDKVIDTARALKVTSPLKALPSLSLGAFEMTAVEVLQVYSTFARLGTLSNLTFIESIADLDGNVIYSHEINQEQVIPKEKMAVLVGMMKQTVISGTAKFMSKLGFTHPAAGKTGTTSDTRDAWFAGFTPYHAAVVWVGYDNNTESQLTGASGAVPIWADYMKQFASQFPVTDFTWPEETSVVNLNREFFESMSVPEEIESLDLVFEKGTEPR